MANESENSLDELPTTKLRPLYNRCVVLRDEPPKQIGSIIVPDIARDRLRREGTRGVVLRVGPGRIEFRKNAAKQLVPTGRRVTPDVKRGDIVWFHHMAGDSNAQYDFEENGLKLTVMWDDECQAYDGDRADILAEDSVSQSAE